MCGDWSAPVVFRVAGTCGPGGVVVVEPDDYSGIVWIANAPALGLPAMDRNRIADVTARYTGTACPITVDKGEWEVDFPSCPGPADASTDAAIIAFAGNGGAAGAGDGGGLGGAGAGGSAAGAGGAGGAGAGAGAGTTGATCGRHCEAIANASGQLELVCTDVSGGELCRSTLTVEE